MMVEKMVVMIIQEYILFTSYGHCKYCSFNNCRLVSFSVMVCFHMICRDLQNSALNGSIPILTQLTSLTML
jgi:hypothetical protein